MIKGYSVEASALPASVGLARPRLAFGASLLRIRSDDQLVALFRDGSEDAFRVIHDRYRSRLHAYARQMLAGSPHDCEDALQEVFMRAYYGLRANRRDLALRPWLYRVAHNRCIDELRRQPLILLDPADVCGGDDLDPVARVEQRDALRQLIADVQRLPDQQRSALLMRELSGMPYADVADALGVSVPAVKSLLVRARVGLAQATEARDTSCAQIREELILAHDRGVRASGLARRHVSDCADCRAFRAGIRGVSRQLAALTPTLGPIGIIANLLGIGGGGGAAAGSTAAAGGVAGGTGAAASAGLLAGGAGHVVTLLAAAMVTAGGAVELQKTIIAPPHHVRHRVAASRDFDPAAPGHPAAVAVSGGLPGDTTASGSTAAAAAAANAAAPPPAGSAAAGHNTAQVPLTQLLDPDHLLYRHMSLGTGTPTVASPGAVTPPAPLVAGASGTATATPGPVVPPITPPATTSPVGSPGATAPSTGESTAAGSTPVGSTPVGDSSSTPAAGSGASTGSAPGGSAATPSSSGTSLATGQAGGATASAPGTSATAGSTTGSTPTKTSSTRPTKTSSSSRPARSGSTVAKTVAAGGALSSRVMTFAVTRRHAPQRFALGTLLPR
jgi:RNA polymerase sigma factor (sigma-70 family)